jgi:hypothetical protein
MMRIWISKEDALYVLNKSDMQLWFEQQDTCIAMTASMIMLRKKENAQ